MAALSLADRDDFSFTAGVGKNGVTRQIVMQDHIGVFERADGFEREQVGIARPRADKEYTTRLAGGIFGARQFSFQ